MFHYTKVVAGAADYIEQELVAKLQGSWKAWVLGAAASLAAARAGQVMQTLAANPIAVGLGIVEGEMVDVETILREIKKQSAKGNITVPIPFIGDITFGAGDIDNLYRYIKNKE